ncbi:hypothetical protein [Parasphingorhabdus sp.]|uniref:hypothetical protein n=1 Tax=Parasphingorhabdus sp. TaxID=2709688 RepID=UPI003C77E83C
MFRSMVTGLIGDCDGVRIVGPHRDLANDNFTEHDEEAYYDILLVEGFSGFAGPSDLPVESIAPRASIVAVEDRGRRVIVFRRRGDDILINNDQAGLIDAIKRAAEQS